MVLLEAMSQGMACIAYDCKTGPSDMLQNELNGLLIPDQDLQAMQQGLNTLMKSEALRRTLGDHALQSLERFAMETVASHWEQLFNHVRS